MVSMEKGICFELHHPFSISTGTFGMIISLLITSSLCCPLPLHNP